MSKVLLCGSGGTGMYLTWRVISTLQRCNNSYRSFKRASGMASLLGKLRPEGARKFPEEPEVDVVWWDHFACYLEVYDHGDRHYLSVDTTLLDRESSLLWSCNKPARSWFPRRTHNVYCLRDGRDVVASLLHKAVSADALAFNPGFGCRTVDELLELPGYVERLAMKWKDHVRGYLEQKAHWIGVSYEAMVSDKRATVASLANALGLCFDEPVLTFIVNETSEGASRAHAPKHTRRARPGGAEELGIAGRVEAVCTQELEAIERLAIGAPGTTR